MQKWARFCETILRERVRKTETNVFEIRQGFPSRRKVREECGGGILDFWAGRWKKKYKNGKIFL